MSLRTPGWSSFPLHTHLNPQIPAAAAGDYHGEGRLIAFTTPSNYAQRLSQLFRLRGWHPLWCPAIVVDITPSTTTSIRRLLSAAPPTLKTPLQDFSAIAFTSKTGIAAFSQVLDQLSAPPLSSAGEIFTISALGNDANLLDSTFVNKICHNPDRIKVLIPAIATPAGLADSLGTGNGRRVMCPVPMVVGLTEPQVVPNFLDDLTARGWIPMRVNSYETRWAGASCAEDVVNAGEQLDALVFTSTAEVEGLVKSLNEYGLEWSDLKKRCPRLLVAVHGPVTAAGAEKQGVAVDVVSPRFDSFDGVISALQSRWQHDSDEVAILEPNK